MNPHPVAHPALTALRCIADLLSSIEHLQDSRALAAATVIRCNALVGELTALFELPDPNTRWSGKRNGVLHSIADSSGWV